MSTKGSWSRVKKHKQFQDNFERIFGTKEKPKTDDEALGDVPNVPEMLKAQAKQ